MNIYDKVNDLASALKQSEEFKAYKENKALIESNETNKRMAMDVKKKQYELQTMVFTGNQPDQAQIEALNNLYQIAATNEDVRKYLDSEARIEMLLADIYKTISQSVEYEIK